MNKEELKAKLKEQRSQDLYSIIESMPNDPEYKAVKGMPIPLGKSVLIKKSKQNIVIAGGIILAESAENSQLPKVGIIYAIGPDCSRGVRVGLRCYYNFYSDLDVRVGVETYAMMEEASVYYILPSHTDKISEGTGIKPAKQVRRAKSIDRDDDYRKRKFKTDMNEKDMKNDKTKGKIFSIKK